MQRDPDPIGALRQQFRQQLLARIESVGVDAAAAQCGQYGRAGLERNFAFRRSAAEDDGDPPELLRGSSRCAPLTCPA